MRAAIYLRISQARDGSTLGVERQEPPCRALADRMGAEVVRVFTDNDLSAYSGKRRPEYEQMLSWVEQGRLDLLIAWHADRFTRQPKENERLIELAEQYGIRLATATGEHDLSTPSGRLHFRMLGSIARYESEHRAERIRLQRRQAAVAGEANQGGRRLFGYTTLPRTIQDDEAAVVRESARRLLSGHSQRSVTAWMNQVSKTTTGREWSQRTVREMLLSPALAGLRTYKGEIVATGNWEPILPVEQWEQLAALLKSRRRRGAPVKHLLSGIVVCGKCGTPLMTHYAPKSRGGRREYMCPKNAGLGRPGCGRLTVTAEGVERVVTQMVLHRLAGPGLARALAARDAEQGAGIAAELAAVDAQVADIEQAYKDLKVKLDAFLRLHEPLVAKADELRARLRQGADGVVLSQLPSAKAELERWWTAAELDQRRAVLMAVVERVVVGPALKASRTFDEARLRPPYGPKWQV